MKFANLEGLRQEPRTGLRAACPSCGGAVIAKCGDQRVWHWAHKGSRTCDHWWEPETKWHRQWKSEFPVAWQEIIQTADSGEKHIADVKTDSGIVIEFQHSFLSPDERLARENFYKKMVWVVDGCRRKHDADQLLKCIGPCVFARGPFVLHTAHGDESALLRDWHASPVPVYFDLGVSPNDGKRLFWRRDPTSRSGKVYLTPVSVDSFLKTHLTGLEAEQKFSEGVAIIVEGFRQAARQSQPAPLAGFQRYLARNRNKRRL